MPPSPSTWTVTAFANGVSVDAGEVSQDEPEAGQGEDQRGEQHGPDQQCCPPPTHTDTSPCRAVQPDRDDHRRDEQEQRQRSGYL